MSDPVSDPPCAPLAPGAHLVLVGLPGAGKTTVGRAAAARLGVPFVDLDEEIERREGRTVAEIFAAEGEPRFRVLEREATAALRGAPGAVVAPGGGWIEQPGLVDLLRPPARLVWLRGPAEALLSRMSDGERARRPLLAGPDPEVAIRRLDERRRALYAAADHVIDTELIGVEKVMDAVVSLVAPAGGGYVTG